MLRFALFILMSLAIMAAAVWAVGQGEQKPAPWRLSISESRP